MRNCPACTYLVVGVRKLAIYEIYAKLSGAHDCKTFYDNMAKFAALLSESSGLPADFYMCAWFRVYNFYVRNRTAILNGGIDGNEERHTRR